MVFFRYTNDDLSNLTNQRRQHKTWTREDNQLRSNLTLREYRKKIIEIWQECARFQTTNQRLVDQVRTIIKKGWFSGLEILEILQKTNSESKQDANTISDTPSIDKQERPNRKELQTKKDRNTTQPNNTEQTLILEQEMNLEI